MKIIIKFLQNSKKAYQYVFVVNHGFTTGGTAIKRYSLNTIMLLRIVLENIYWMLPKKIQSFLMIGISEFLHKIRRGLLGFTLLFRRSSIFEVHPGKSHIDNNKETILTVMSCFNQLEYSKQTLDSYYNSLDENFNYILLVTDDHSTDDTQAFFTQEVTCRRNMYYFRYKSNFGLTQAWNDGIHFGLTNLKADYIFLINNDIIIPPGSIAKMVSHLDQNPDVGVIGPLSNSPGHQTAQDIRRFLKKYWPSDSLKNICNTNILLNQNTPIKIPFVNGFFMGFPASILEKMAFRWMGRVYYFDPKNRNYKNETEFQKRLKKKFIPSMIATDVFIFHYKDVSQKSLSNFSEKVFRKSLVPENSTDTLLQQAELLEILQETQPVIIIGMHRSGTSLISRILIAGGIQMGADLDKNNESRYFQRLNNVLLFRSNSAWWNIENFTTHLDDLEFIENQKIFLQSILLSNKLSEGYPFALDSHFGDSYLSGFNNQNTFLWGSKDPRFTLTLPVWLKIFPKAKVLHVIRNGIDVALSLSTRSQYEIKQNLDCTGCITENIKYSFHLWEKYVSLGRKFCHILPENQYSEIRYEDLLQDPEILFHVFKNWGLDFDTDSASQIVQGIHRDRLQFNSRSIGHTQIISTFLSSPVMRELGYSYNIPHEPSSMEIVHAAPVSKKNYLSICAIFKNEATYLKEWIEFHRLVGVEKFYLYNNNSTDNYLDVLESYIQNGIVVLTQWPMEKGQTPAYNDCISRFRHHSFWIAFIDIDEFLFGTCEDHLPTLLKNYEAYPGIQVNWLVFGSSGHMTRPPGLVTENYVWRADYQIHRGDIGTYSTESGSTIGFVTKSIVRMDAVIENLNPHLFNYKNNTIPVDETFRFQRAPLTMYLQVDSIRINHYFCKSYEEMQSRIAKGSATGRKKNTRLLKGVDRNEIEDHTIMRFLPQLKKNIVV